MLLNVKVTIKLFKSVSRYSIKGRYNGIRTTPIVILMGFFYLFYFFETFL